MEDTAGRLLTTPLFQAFVGRARPGDRFDADPARRASAWAHWAVGAVREFKGVSDRTYDALALDGAFYDPDGSGPKVRPHLELTARTLQRPDGEFPDRLALFGNALAFPQWLLAEVTAVRRALLATPPAPISAAVDLFGRRRGDLADSVRAHTMAVTRVWSEVQSQALADPDGFSEVATAPMGADEVAAFFPSAEPLGLRVQFDAKLQRRSGGRAGRRVGVWQIFGEDDGLFAFGVATPRITRNSLVDDDLFAVDRESPAALLVRGLLLRRLVAAAGGTPAAAVSDPAPQPDLRLRAQPARVGARIPEAGVESAVRFLQAFPDAQNAWQQLVRWAGDRYLLTVAADGFMEAHRNAWRALRRTMEPDRDDINVLLPVAWDTEADGGRVVRVVAVRTDG